MEARYLTDLEWRICHAINIYVYRNGMDGESPILVHIPPSKKKSMRTVLSAIQDRVSFPVGYPTHLYRMDGRRIRHPCELEQYNNYVVSSNYDKHFKCVQYGRKRSPLLVLNRDSKHIRVLRLQNSNYRDWIMKKEATVEERPFAPHFYPPTYAANDQPSNTELGNASFGGTPISPGRQLGSSQPQRGPQDYVVQNCEVITDNPEANEAILRLQERVSFSPNKKVQEEYPFVALRSHCPAEPPRPKPVSSPPNKQDSLPKIPSPPALLPLPVIPMPQPQPQNIIDPFEKYKLPLPPKEFRNYQEKVEKILSSFAHAVNGNPITMNSINMHSVNMNSINGNSMSRSSLNNSNSIHRSTISGNSINGNSVPNEPKKSYEDFRDIKPGAISDGGSSSVPNESGSMSYEDLRVQNKFLLQKARRKDRKLKKLIERNSSLMLARRRVPSDSEGSEMDYHRYVTYKTSRRGVSYKHSRPAPKYFALPPPPLPFRDELVSCLPADETAAAIARFEFLVTHQNLDDRYHDI